MTQPNATSATGTVWSECHARTSARALLATAGIQAGELRLLRFGNNAVFQVDELYVLRVARPITSPTSLRHEVQVACALAEHRVPVVRLATLPVPQPLVTNGVYGTLWDAIPPGPSPTYQQLGWLLREFHDRTESFSIQLPSWEPLATARQRLDTLTGQYPPDDIDLLEEWYQRINASLADLQPVLSTGVIHGQAEIGNVLLRDGQPIFLDLERVARGPREWDLIDTAVTTLRFNMRRDGYRAFVEAYGFDVTTWVGFATLRRVWELRATTWLMQARDHRPEIAREVQIRLNTWRDGDTGQIWHGF